jgi:23S rRNA (uracil1939-C5)-methyltransferase
MVTSRSRSKQQALEREKAAYPKVQPPCPYVGTCGGCSLQDLAYPDQLALKAARVQRALSPLGMSQPVEVQGLEEPWRYRNKAELTFSVDDGRLILGYHAAGSFQRVIDVEDCLLLPQPAMQVARDLLALAAQTGMPPYHPKTHQGFFRHLVVRRSFATGQILLCLLTTPGERAVVEGLARAIRARHQEVASFYWGISSRLADVAIPEELVLLEGSEFLEDRLGPFQLLLHPLSFLQPSSLQAERIYATLTDALHPAAGSTAWDLYCGIGLVSFYLAASFQMIYAVDVDPRHLSLAARNAELNGVRNLAFRAGTVEALLANRRFWLQEAKPDVIVVDPPRAGLHPAVMPSLLAARPRRLAYLSCNLQSLARDLAGLLGGFPRYRISRLWAFDMFPQTDHIETLTLLDR